MKTIFVIFFTIMFVSVEAQQTFEKKINIGAGINAGIPVGIFSTIYSFTYGGNIKAELSISQKFIVTSNVGYYKFLGKGSNEGVSFIPILAGFKYHFVPKVFIGSQAGISISTLKNVGAFFSFAPEFGYNISKKLEVTGSYTAIEKYGFIIGSTGIELAYYFK